MGSRFESPPPTGDTDTAEREGQGLGEPGREALEEADRRGARAAAGGERRESCMASEA
jgi:hypothetical protein